MMLHIHTGTQKKIIRLLGCYRTDTKAMATFFSAQDQRKRETRITHLSPVMLHIHTGTQKKLSLLGVPPYRYHGYGRETRITHRSPVMLKLHTVKENKNNSLPGCHRTGTMAMGGRLE